MITLDFETRSAADLRKTGTYAYACHPTTSANCLAFTFDDDEEVFVWHPAFPNAWRKPGTKRIETPLEECRPDALNELFLRIDLGDEVEAHNALFERCIWHFVMVGKFGWPAVDPMQWRCSAAKAASYGLPRKLEHAVNALGLAEMKDMDGNRLALKMAKPRKPLKAEWHKAGFSSAEEYTRERGLLWHEDVDDIERLLAYCRQDVRSERALSRQLRDLNPEELATWRLDQEINLRGVYCDRALATKALKLVADHAEAANNEVVDITGYAVTGCTKREELLAWVRGEGVALPDTQAATLDRFLAAHDLPEPVERVLTLWRSVNKTSTKKYRAMLERIGVDDRIRDILMYWAAHTGRWGGRGIQPQNFPRGFSVAEPKKGKIGMEQVCQDILDCDLQMIELLYGDIMETLANALRGAIIAPPGRDLEVADYSAIEARGTFWVAGHAEGLRRFREIDAGKHPGQDIYTWQASDILGRKVTKADGEARQVFGKVPVLGCGYQMGAGKLVAYAASMGVTIDEEQADLIVKGYRATNRPVVEFWRNVENAAIEAVRRGHGAKPVRCGHTQWAVRGRFLHCRLPSGRLLSYCDPKIELEKTPWDEWRPKLRYWGVDSYTKKWTRLATYGGKLTENVVQALCRDIMRDAMLRVDAHPTYDLVLTVHDEIVSEVDEGAGSTAEFEALIAEVPEWAPGFPIAAEGWRGKRYRK